MKFAKKYYRTAFYFLGIALALYLMESYGFSVIWEQLNEVSWYFAVILLVWLAVYLLNALSWNIIINSSFEKMPFSKIFGLIVSGYAINSITPFISLGGEPYRILNLKKYMPGGKATSLVLQYAMMHMYSHIWFWVLGLVVMLAEIGLVRANIYVIVSSLILVVALFFIFNNLFRKSFLQRLFRFLSKVPSLKKLLSKYADKEEKIIEIDTLISDLYKKDRKAFYKSLFAEFASRIAGALEILFILKAIGVEISFSESIYISAASSLIANILFFMPMQLGVREGGLYFVIQSIALSPGLGIFISLVTRIREFVWIIIGFMIMPFIDKKGLKRGKI